MDVLLFQTADGGDVTAANGQIALTAGLETAVYLSLFGGNSDDSGLTADDSKQFWANFDEPDPAKTYRSEFQFLINSLPLIPANLQRFEEAAMSDLQWLTNGVADSVAAVASMPGINRVQVSIAVVIDGKTSLFKITPPVSAG